MMFRGEQRHTSAVCVLPELQVGYRAQATHRDLERFRGEIME
jgi:hypothetical protein